MYVVFRGVREADERQDDVYIGCTSQHGDAVF